MSFINWLFYFFIFRTFNLSYYSLLNFWEYTFPFESVTLSMYVPFVKNSTFIVALITSEFNTNFPVNSYTCAVCIIKELLVLMFNSIIKYWYYLFALLLRNIFFIGNIGN